nr:hypothetical protein [Tanacetum cinerariifolium]
VPSAAPVARAPYRLAPSGMKDLLEQLKELSDKGVIRPGFLTIGSSSPVRQKEGWIVSDDKKEHEEHLRQILELLKKEELYAKFSKCEFWIPKVQFLGHVIDSQGLVGYYRRFIEGFSKIAKPMTKLTQNKVKFEWGDKQEAAFQLLKQKLYSAPILALPEVVVRCTGEAVEKGGILAGRTEFDAIYLRMKSILSRMNFVGDEDLISSYLCVSFFLYPQRSYHFKELRCSAQCLTQLRIFKMYILNEKGGPKEDECIMSYQSQGVSIWEGAEVVHLQAEYSSRSLKIFSRILYCMSIIFLFACRERCNQFTCDAILEGDC